MRHKSSTDLRASNYSFDKIEIVVKSLFDNIDEMIEDEIDLGITSSYCRFTTENKLLDEQASLNLDLNIEETKTSEKLNFNNYDSLSK